jgi:hypothetical protein
MVLPLIAAGIGLIKGADAIGEAAKDFSNVGKNKFQATAYEAQPVAAMGGQAQHYAQMGQDGKNNAMSQANYAQGQMIAERGPQAQENLALANREAQARGFQQDSLNLDRQAAMGNAPSVAARQMQAGMDQAVAGQASQAASARGMAGLAMAQSNGQANVANVQNQTFNQAAQLRAAEMAQARQAYQQGAGAFRQGDQGRLQMGNQMSQFNAQQNDQYRLGMGQLGIGYQQAGQGWNAQSMDALKQQQGADIAAQAINADSYNNAQALNAGVSQANADERARMRDRWVSMGTGAFNTAGGMMKGAGGGGGGSGSGGAGGK